MISCPHDVIGYTHEPGAYKLWGQFRTADGAVVTVPFSSTPTRFGTWNVHGGLEYLRLGAERTRAPGENQVVGAVGIGFSY